MGLLAGAIAAAITVLVGAGAIMAALVGLCLGYWTMVVFGWLNLWPLDAEETKANARRAELPPVLEEVLMVAVAVCGMLAVGLTTALADPGVAIASLALVGVFGGWACLHLMYATRYARLYHRPGAGPHGGGIDFNQDAVPAYRDFFYFAYNLGMTYQVSDTSVSDSQIRATTLRHCLLSYVFGAVILATAISLVSGLITN